MTISWKKLVATCFVLRQGGGRIFVTSLHFTYEKAPMFALSQPTTVLHTNNPATFLLSMNSSYA